MRKYVRQLYSWGHGVDGQLGLGMANHEPIRQPMEIPKLKGLNVKSIGAGISHSVALVGNGSVYVWGGNYFGQAGWIPELSGGIFDNDDDEYFEPAHLSVGFKDKKMIDVQVANFHALALSEDKQVFSWFLILIS